MKKVCLLLMALAAMLASQGCLDSSRALSYSIDPEISRKINDTYFEKKMVAASMRKVLAASLLISDKAMFYSNLLKVDDDEIEQHYGLITKLSANTEGDVTFIDYEKNVIYQTNWGKLARISLRGPYIYGYQIFRGPLSNKAYYLMLIVEDGRFRSHVSLRFTDLHGAKIFAALVLRMAELSGNYNVQIEL